MNVKTLAISLVLAVVGFAACADVMNELEKATDQNSLVGKAVRGANRVRKSFQDLDPAEEHYIGRAVAAQVLTRGYEVSKDEALADYVNKVGHAVVYLSDEVRHTFIGYRFAVLESNEVNAFATPGGTVFVTRGLIEATQSEDELAAVLAHEVAHVTLRHGLEAIQESNLLGAFQYLGESAAEATLGPGELDKLSDIFGDSVDDIVLTMVEKGYDRDKEYAADEAGESYVKAAGYRTGVLAAFIARLDGEGGLMSTHPGPGERVEELGSPPLGAIAPEAEQARNARYHRLCRH